MQALSRSFLRYEQTMQSTIEEMRNVKDEDCKFSTIVDIDTKVTQIHDSVQRYFDKISWFKQGIEWDSNEWKSNAEELKNCSKKLKSLEDEAQKILEHWKKVVPLEDFPEADRVSITRLKALIKDQEAISESLLSTIDKVTANSRYQLQIQVFSEEQNRCFDDSLSKGSNNEDELSKILSGRPWFRNYMRRELDEWTKINKRIKESINDRKEILAHPNSGIREHDDELVYRNHFCFGF